MASSRSRAGVLWAVTLAAAACNGDPAALTLAACHTDVVPLVLSIAVDTAVDPVASSGCVLIAANGGIDSVEYLLVPQASTTSPDYHSSFKLAGGAPITAALAAQLQAMPASPAERFHQQLRIMEQEGVYPVPAGAQGANGAVAPSVQAAGAPDTLLGSQWTFKVLSNISNPTFSTQVSATARSVGQHVIIYVDDAAPAGGLSTAELDKMRSDFDTLLYAVDTTAFGRESDIDGNHRVIVLMSNVINRLVTAQDCVQSGYITGFFFASDLAPGTRAMWNNGEIFYTMIGDSAGTLPSCPHPNSQVNRVVPVTFVHEFQHMISFNQHVLVRGGFSEVLWLNEGMSHYAEERAGWMFRQRGDDVRFCNHVRGDLYNFGLYVTNPGAYGLVGATGTGSLAERGAYWAFVRYLVDQFSSDTSLAAADAFTRQLVRTSSNGTDNVAQRTGVPFGTLAKRWVLANWVSDLPGFTAPASMKYKHWAFRTDYPALHASCTQMLPDPYPLAAPGSAPATINVAGTMYAGSAGTYQRALQGPGDPQIRLIFSDGTGAELQGSVLPRLNVLRIR